MLPTSSARWNPDVIACDAGIPAASWSFVRLVETAVKMASPGAPPSHCDALSSAAACSRSSPPRSHTAASPLSTSSSRSDEARSRHGLTQRQCPRGLRFLAVNCASR